MSDIQEQLAELRKRIARIDERYAARAGSGPSWSTGTLTHVVQGNAPSDRRPARYFVEEYLSGSEVRTAAGAHFESERLWERTRNHGSFELSALDELGPNLLEAISNGAITNCACDKWAFLDTETTGLAGGAGTYA
ncbi:MAG TPA: hypothetical protein VE621_12295, partial [Bryobacteraceae bacterium]|nr:hypothetical protein [Bryobacteraceae bacterium]